MKTYVNGECILVGYDELCLGSTVSVDGACSSKTTEGGSSICLKRPCPFLSGKYHSKSTSSTSSSARSTCPILHISVTIFSHIQFFYFIFFHLELRAYNNFFNNGNKITNQYDKYIIHKLTTFFHLYITLSN